MTSLSELIESYLDGIQSLRRAVAGMTREQLVARPVPGKWSTLEVVCHLVDSDQAWIHRMKRIIAEQRPLLIGYDETRFTTMLGYHERALDDELHLFEKMREQMACVLRGLPADALDRTAVHNESGLLTLLQAIELEIDHVAHHLQFIVEKRRALGCG